MKYIKNWFLNNRFPIIAFTLWRSVLGLVVWLFAKNNLALHPKFPYYLSDLANKYPRSLSTFAFFDGIHYIRIAEYGYTDTGTQAFFPAFPILIRYTTKIFKINYLQSGLILSSLFFLLALIVVWNTFNKETARKIILLLLTFPTSFFFISVYTEGLFVLLFSLWLYAYKKHRQTNNHIYILYMVYVSAFASLTRITGVVLSLATSYILLKTKHSIVAKIYKSFLSFLGFISYSTFLFIKFGDPIMFLHVQSMFGANRSSRIILPLQTIWRYIKILITAQPTTILYYRATLEFAIFMLGLLFIYKLIQLQKYIEAIISLLMLTLTSFTGSLSSTPRYILVIVPIYYSISQLLNTKLALVITILISTTLQLILLTLFSMGEFIA